LTESIKAAKSKAESRGQYLPVVASVCGTVRDPQDFVSQVDQLRKIGVVVMPSNAQAARFAAKVAAKNNNQTS
jgi:FdrA protein